MQTKIFKESRDQLPLNTKKASWKSIFKLGSLRIFNFISKGAIAITRPPKVGSISMRTTLLQPSHACMVFLTNPSLRSMAEKPRSVFAASPLSSAPDKTTMLRRLYKSTQIFKSVMKYFLMHFGAQIFFQFIPALCMTWSRDQLSVNTNTVHFWKLFLAQAERAN